MWYAKSVEQVLREFQVSPSEGLSEAEVRNRRLEYGQNELMEKKQKSLFVLFFEQLNNVLIYILIAAAVISIFLGEISDAVIILSVVLINGIVGVVQEAKAEQAITALKKMTSPKALVRREGQVLEIEASMIVPGDIVLLEAGRIVPCDLRLLETADLQIEESALTGESVPVMKSADCVLEESGTALGDRINTAFMSTIVTLGRGTGVAVETGMTTQIGRIAEMLESEQKELTPLQKKLASFGKLVGIIILVLCAVMFGVSMLEQFLKHHVIPREVLFEFFLTAVSLAVAAIPEGLPAIVTIVLAVGVQRMSRKNAIVRKLPAVETLGSVSVICSDKTGTLTQNKMTVTQFFADGTAGGSVQLSADHPAQKMLLEVMVLCNDAGLGPEGSSTGDPTEIALLEAGEQAGIGKTEMDSLYPRIGEKPFDSSRKMMSTLHGTEKGTVIMTKGAIDSLLSVCTKVLEKGKETVLTEEKKTRLLESAGKMSGEALRVLAAAYRKSGQTAVTSDDFERDLTFAGFLAMKDPPRMEVKSSIQECRSAGIRTVMITGDHRATAFAIAKELGIAERKDQVLSGTDLDNLTDSALSGKVKDVHVFARVSPEHKVRIVNALQASGNIVSMTGDGVNDAPSLNTADIGVAMGKGGTDVAKGASDMVLTDDNFSTIVAAVAEGRNIYNNIKKTITFLLSCNAGEIAAIFTAIIIGWVPPLRPIHILWVNLITDTFPALALGMDPGDPNIMKATPRPVKESLFAGGAGKNIILNGILIGFLTLCAYRIGRSLYPGSVMHAQTIAFAVLSFSQLFHAFNLRSENRSVFSTGILSNRFLAGAFLFGVLLQVLVITVPGVSDVFKVIPLLWCDWLLVAGFSIMPVVVNECIKFIGRVRNRPT